MQGLLLALHSGRIQTQWAVGSQANGSVQAPRGPFFPQVKFTMKIFAESLEIGVLVVGGRRP